VSVDAIHADIEPRRWAPSLPGHERPPTQVQAPAHGIKQSRPLWWSRRGDQAMRRVGPVIAQSLLRSFRVYRRHFAAAMLPAAMLPLEQVDVIYAQSSRTGENGREEDLPFFRLAPPRSAALHRNVLDQLEGDVASRLVLELENGAPTACQHRRSSLAPRPRRSRLFGATSSYCANDDVRSNSTEHLSK